MQCQGCLCPRRSSSAPQTPPQKPSPLRSSTTTRHTGPENPEKTVDTFSIAKFGAGIAYVNVLGLGRGLGCLYEIGLGKGLCLGKGLGVLAQHKSESWVHFNLGSSFCICHNIPRRG